MLSLKEKAAATAKLLDEQRPGWYSQINIDDLHMADDCGCVIGQLDGNFFTADVTKLGGPVSTIRADRLDWGNSVGLSDSNSTHFEEDIDEIWIDLIDQRSSA